MIEKLPFGRTGHESTRTLFGAAAFSDVTQEDADQTLEILAKYGVNHFDVAASYGDAELRLGPWIENHRSEVFLASKTGERSYTAARDQIRRSLDRLRTDHLDLIQLHAVVEDVELKAALGKDGALKAAIEAREQGLVNFIGITSHTLHAPVIHLAALEKFAFDSVLLPCNYMLMQNQVYRSNFEALMSVCKEKNIAVQLIKTAQRRPWGDQPHFSATWYEPFNDQHSLDLAIHWALTRPDVFINTAGDIHILPMILEAASRYKGSPSEQEMQALMDDQETIPLWA